ncbi:MAG: ribonuclease E/G [Moorea sp. SIOASIH]|uniref:Rne/Rng family ribonuclease n=1 Tax=Moorena sp. SIOASIH TaxID=2607817 RepID=UPI0013B992AD|nr:Rne/Rng family ribonuclease [Moorena sp. SIOASIH]NEO40403.1 ribonuclease E/G [Moorena sp. SIOASIH]NEO89387.1 ribonuclease E/G [Moorena sp. SIO3G5]
MPKQIIIAEQHQLAAVFWEDQIQELVVATGNHQVGDIYLGIVENVLPGIDAAFVNIGDPDRNGFIHVTDLGPLRLKRRSGAITELLTPQQKVLVQVMKEPTGNKGPRLTGNISLPGRYLVLMPYGRGVNLSRRIKSESERNRLRALAILIKPSGMGVLVRTEAEGRAEEAIMEDLENLQRQWEAVQLEATSTRAPALLNRDDDFIQRVLRDMYTADVNRIVVDSSTAVKRVKQHLLSWSGGQAPEGVLIDHHRDRMPILGYFRVNAAIREALKPRVDLPSGGYIIIEPTEALTVIDVNSGSFTRSATARETVLWTNCEAATEIARQLRLRNLAGVIVVDFIDMDTRRDQLQVLEHFNQALKEDKARPQIAQLSELGLVELTRKRQGQNIYELFGKTCATCGGLGHLVHLPGEVEAEALETLAPIPLPTERSIPEFPEPVDLSPENDNELDLLNHPSYQERGAVNNRRRRRRRIDDPVIREEPITRGVNRVISVSSNFDAITEPEVSSSGVEKPQLVKFAQEKEPPELVRVEMSPEEQDVYALMGISPILHLDREVKDPRSAIISVLLPGEKIEDNEEELSNTTTDSTTDSTNSQSSIDDQLELDESDLVQSTAATPIPETGSDQLSTTNGTINSPPIVRRRRRRSSALDK